MAMLSHDPEGSLPLQQEDIEEPVIHLNILLDNVGPESADKSIKHSVAVLGAAGFFRG